MSSSRYDLNDLQWGKIKDFPPGRKEHVGRTAAGNRLWHTKVGPREFGYIHISVF